MRHLPHGRLRREVEAYVDGELGGPARIAAVERHLDDCLDCRRDLHVLRLMKCSLRRLAGNRPTDLTTARLRRWARQLTS